jgi:beta-galactosidase
VDDVQVALVHDTDARWACELDSHPSVDVSTIAETRSWHDAFWRAGVTTDFRQSTDDLSGYRLVVVPVQYLITDAGAAGLAEYVRAGGHLVVTYFSGIADEYDHIRLGGYPGAFSDLLGVRIEEFHPLHQGESISLTRYGSGRIWSESGAVTTAQVLAEYAVLAGDAPGDRVATRSVAGSPAVTSNDVGAGRAYYVGTSLDRPSLEGLVAELLAEAGVTSVLRGVPPGVEAVRRRGTHGAWTFVINHTASAVDVAISGHELIADAEVQSTLSVAAGGVAVVRL